MNADPSRSTIKNKPNVLTSNSALPFKISKKVKNVNIVESPYQIAFVGYHQYPV
jgi:hypothetical protein